MEEQNAARGRSQTLRADTRPKSNGAEVAEKAFPATEAEKIAQDEWIHKGLLSDDEDYMGGLRPSEPEKPTTTTTCDKKDASHIEQLPEGENVLIMDIRRLLWMIPRIMRL